jgi:hypothetical protein
MISFNSKLTSFSVIQILVNRYLVYQMRNWSVLCPKQLKQLTNYRKCANNYSLEFCRQSCIRRESLVKTTSLLWSLSSSETIRKKIGSKEYFFQSLKSTYSQNQNLKKEMRISSKPIYSMQSSVVFRIFFKWFESLFK